MAKKHKYCALIDAGSSGSRIYVYEYKTAEYVEEDNDTKELGRLPKVKTKKHWHKKIHPGISTFGETPERVGEDHLKDLVAFAEDIIPKDDLEDTPVFLLATAGMRLLPSSQRDAVLDNVCSYLQRNSNFQLPDCGLHIQIIPGETEGLYGWIAANYLLGGFDKPEKHEHGKGHSTYGFLDMGGASAQIAFAPNATEAEKHADDLKLLRLRKVNGEPLEYGVFVTTWLGFGANEARRRYVDNLLEAYPDEPEIPDPCLPVGLRVNQTGAEIDDPSQLDYRERILLGTGHFAECLDSTYPLLEKTKKCEDEPCLVNGVHTPAIDFDVNHFVGVSEYWHTTHEIFAMAHKDKAYDFHTYQKQVTELCERDWAGLEADVAKETWGHKVDEQTIEEVCFKASWLINMLHDGIGIPRMGKEHVEGAGDGHENQTNAVLDGAEDRGFLDPFQAVDEIDGTEVSWTLGKMVLYASSQMPAAEGAMAVGFGSNIPGKDLPSDFQFPSGQHDSITITPQEAENGEDQDWHDQIFSSSYTRRISGIVIVLLIIALVIYFLLGRERRIALWNKLTGRSKPHSSRPSKRRKGTPGFLKSALFGTGEPAYERVYGQSDDVDVELAEASEDHHFSDSSSDGDLPPRIGGRTSGLATPTSRGLSPDVTRGSPRSTGYFDSVSTNSSTASSANNTLGVSPFERGGLTVRAESSERLERLAPNNLRRSRTGSPKRSPLFSPMSPFKESVD